MKTALARRPRNLCNYYIYRPNHQPENIWFHAVETLTIYFSGNVKRAFLAQPCRKNRTSPSEENAIEHD